LLQQGKRWLRNALPLVPVSLNVSARQFLSLDLVELSSSIARELDIGLEWLRFDLEEAALHADFARATHKITALSQLGILVNLEHFGQGLVSLNRICDLKLNNIKIVAKHFENESEMKKNDALISIIQQVGRVLRLPIVATQIESEAMACRAMATGLEYLQGYFISRPLSPESAETWLRNRTGPDEAAPSSSAAI